MRSILTQQLIANGFQRDELLGCSLGELALLRQQTFVDNYWTAAARAARQRQRNKARSDAHAYADSRLPQSLGPKGPSNISKIKSAAKDTKSFSKEERKKIADVVKKIRATRGAKKSRDLYGRRFVGGGYKEI